jgi:hypothetical protein
MSSNTSSNVPTARSPPNHTKTSHHSNALRLTSAGQEETFDYENKCIRNKLHADWQA